MDTITEALDRIGSILAAEEVISYHDVEVDQPGEMTFLTDDWRDTYTHAVDLTASPSGFTADVFYDAPGGDLERTVTGPTLEAIVEAIVDEIRTKFPPEL